MANCTFPVIGKIKYILLISDISMQNNHLTVETDEPSLLIKITLLLRMRV